MSYKLSLDKSKMYVLVDKVFQDNAGSLSCSLPALSSCEFGFPFSDSIANMEFKTDNGEKYFLAVSKVKEDFHLYVFRESSLLPGCMMQYDIDLDFLVKYSMVIFSDDPDEVDYERC